MHERTRFRLAMLENGYWPILNRCKEPVMNGWQKTRPDEGEIISWDRSLHRSTGMKIDGDLMAIDADANDEALVEALANALARAYPAFFRGCLVRHAEQAKEAWFVRTDEPFRYIASRKWHRENDVDGDVKYFVECFGSARTRQFGVDGPHTIANGEVIRSYRFAGNISPANLPRCELPVLPKACAVAACNLFDEIAQRAGLKIVPSGEPHNGEGARVVYDLRRDMTFEGTGGAAYRLDDLKDAWQEAQHDGRDLRLSSSFLGAGHNTSKCIVGWSRVRNCICVHDFETGVTHLPADRDRSNAVLKLIKTEIIRP